MTTDTPAALADELEALAADVRAAGSFIQSMECAQRLNNTLRNNLPAILSALRATTEQALAEQQADIVAWLRELATHTNKYGPDAIADNIERGRFAHWLERRRTTGGSDADV